jgi:hypothetical protein
MEEQKLIRIGQIWKDRKLKTYFMLSLVANGKKVAMISLTDNSNRFFEPIEVGDIGNISKVEAKKLFDMDVVYVGMVKSVIKIKKPVKRVKKHESNK